MPAVASTEKVTYKSSLRHRPIPGDDLPGTTTATPTVSRASRPRLADVDEQVVEWRRHPEEYSTGEPAANEKQRRNSIPRTKIKALPHSNHAAQSRQFHPLLHLSLGMLAMILLWMTLSSLVGWVQNELDTLRYGTPRTFQIDARVGHNGDATGTPSHFIALNLNGHIEIIEIQGGDASHTRIYLGPQLYGANASLVPATLSFMDVNGDHRPDMIINVQGTHTVFINDQGGFRPLLPAEHAAVEQFLQRHGG